MKKLLLFLFLPLSIFAQERQQKSNFRNYGSVSPGGAPSTLGRSNPINPAFEQRPSIGEFGQKQILRDQNRYKPGSNIPNGNGNVYLYDPYWDGGWGWGWNRWNRWGAPVWGWDYWEPHWYYDRWGYRQPARIYYYDDGKKTDTVKGVKPRMSLGIQANKNEIGGFFTIGKTVYFIFEYQHTYKPDKSVYYPDLTKDVVIPWEDKQLEDIVKGGTVYVGIGRRYGKTGIHSQLGITTERNRYQFFDEYYILSNNGRYSIPSYKDTYATLKVGAIHDFKFATGKVDYDLVRKLVTIGVGVNF